MESILFSPKNEEELELLKRLAKQMRIKTRVLSDEDKEEAALLRAMKETENDAYVSQEEVMKALQ